MVSPSRNQFGNLGKPSFHALKLDEFLKNIVSVEESYQHLNVVHPSSSSSSSSSPPFFLLGDFSKKEINLIHQQQQDFNSIDPHGETTREDFLIRAGVINVTSIQNGTIDPPPQHRQSMAIDPTVMIAQQSADWLQLQMEQQQRMAIDSKFHRSDESLYENPGQLSVPMPAISVTSSESHAEKKRRYSDEMMVKTIERRQKRMIKNRESAARSRARKQAYTNQLENEVSELKKTNAWLRKLKEKEMLLFSDSISLPRFQLRRTSSATL